MSIRFTLLLLASLAILRIESLICRVQVIDATPEEEQEEYKCLLDGHSMSYTLDLPQVFIDEHPHVGSSHVSITNARTVWDPQSMLPPSIFIPTNATFSLVQPPNRRLLESRPSQAHGNKTVLVLRVTSPDGTVDLSKEQLYGRIFGIGSQVPRRTVQSQYSACSYGKLDFIPAQGNGVVNGVAEITIDSNVDGVDPEYLEPIIAARAEALLGINAGTLDASFDHILFVLPYGSLRRGNTRKWFGFAQIGGKRTFYNNENAGYLTIVMHEIGHNYFQYHSSEHGWYYGDTSGIMGSSYQKVDIPYKCFNGYKNYLFGWYADKTIDVDITQGSWVGNIAGLTNYDVARPQDYMIVKVGDIYLQYNRAETFNLFTGDDPNQITIVQGISFDQRSNLLGAVSKLLPDSEQFPSMHRVENFQGTGFALIIEACEQTYLSRHSEDLPDIIRVSVHLEDGMQSSDCFQPTAVAPTPNPTQPPSPSPTAHPTLSPTSSPTTPPSNSPIVEQSMDCTGMDQDVLIPVNSRHGNRTCEWIGGHMSWKTYLCREGYEAFERCQDTCDSCNAQATGPPNDSCEDSKKMFYVDERLGHMRCYFFGQFLSRNPHLKPKFCAPDQNAYDECPETCGKCTDTCEDQQGVSFYVNRRQGRQDCAWLTKRPLWQAKLCYDGHDAYKYCNELCNSCP